METLAQGEEQGSNEKKNDRKEDFNFQSMQISVQEKGNKGNG